MRGHKLLNRLGLRKGNGGVGLVETGHSINVGSFRVKVLSRIGEGGHAYVYKVKDNATGVTYALKQILLGGDVEMQYLYEKSALEVLSGNKNVVKLFASTVLEGEDGHREGLLLLEYCQTSLTSILLAAEASEGTRKQRPLSDSEILTVFGAVCSALEALHGASLAHRDIKVENILLGGDDHWKLCDFGSVCGKEGVRESKAEIAEEENIIQKTTTPSYRPPEMWDLYSRKCVGRKVDMWMAGCLLYRLCYGDFPFADNKVKILTCEYTLPPFRAEGLRALIRALLIAEPEERLDSRQAHQAAHLLMQELSRREEEASIRTSSRSSSAEEVVGGRGMNARRKMSGDGRIQKEQMSIAQETPHEESQMRSELGERVRKLEAERDALALRVADLEGTVSRQALRIEELETTQTQQQDTSSSHLQSNGDVGWATFSAFSDSSPSNSFVAGQEAMKELEASDDGGNGIENGLDPLPLIEFGESEEEEDLAEGTTNEGEAPKAKVSIDLFPDVVPLANLISIDEVSQVCSPDPKGNTDVSRRHSADFAKDLRLARHPSHRRTRTEGDFLDQLGEGTLDTMAEGSSRGVGNVAGEEGSDSWAEIAL